MLELVAKRDARLPAGVSHFRQSPHSQEQPMQPQSAASFLLPDPRSLFRAFGDLNHLRAKIPPFLPLNQSMQRTSPCFYFAVKVPFARQMVQKVHLNNSTWASSKATRTSVRRPAAHAQARNAGTNCFAHVDWPRRRQEHS